MSYSENRFPLFRDKRALTPVFAGYALGHDLVQEPVAAPDHVGGKLQRAIQ